MTKAQIIEALKLREAKKWQALQDHETYCRLVNGDDSKEEDWMEFQISMKQRYTKEWFEINETLKELGIEAFTWSERQELINDNKL
jgi:hypothetical protein